MSKDKRSRDTAASRDYAEGMRSNKDTEFDKSDAPTALVVQPDSPEELGLEAFSPEGSDLVQWTPHTRRQLAEQGYQQVEKYLSLKPILIDGVLMPVGVEAFILGWSATLIPDIADATKLRYLRKLHLELKSGSRCSMLENAQLSQLFSVPLDGSVSAHIYRGGMTTLPDGRQMAQFESSIKLHARGPTHVNGRSYAQICGEAALVFQLQSMTTMQLARVENAPAGMLEPYITAAKERELLAAMAARDASGATTAKA